MLNFCDQTSDFFGSLSLIQIRVFGLLAIVRREEYYWRKLVFDLCNGRGPSSLTISYILCASGQHIVYTTHTVLLILKGLFVGHTRGDVLVCN